MSELPGQRSIVASITLFALLSVAAFVAAFFLPATNERALCAVAGVLSLVIVVIGCLTLAKVKRQP